jgi:hypothetical protein
MTPDRLRFLLEECFQRQRAQGRPGNYELTARFLGVTPMTLRRWLKGYRPIPRAVAALVEIFHEYPAVCAERINSLLGEDEETKQH